MATAPPPSVARPALARPPGAPPVLVWRLDPPRSVLSSAPVGGGLGARSWILNAQVAPGYARTDLAVHARELSDHAGLDPDAGVALFTAADVQDVCSVDDGGVRADVTAGVRLPMWAAAPAEAGLAEPVGAGTINIVVVLPVWLGGAALVNAVATATEAKTQALLDCGVHGTGTATDAVCLVNGPEGGEAVAFGGPRSEWGARLARAVHAAVVTGTRASLARLAGDAGRRTT
jgi:adenosylcobinamide hydrolase